LSLTNHWLTSARRVLSPNSNERPPGADITLLVIHNISLPPGEFGGGYVEQLFTNCLDCSHTPAFDDLQGVEVSSHVLIDREGQLSQFVPFDQRAWHAGESAFEGTDNCNDYSIGIELEGTDDCPYTDSQYQSLVAICRLLMDTYPGISVERIVGHCEIAPHRKTDPGMSFDWNYFREQLER
jgi:AmpD protein